MISAKHERDAVVAHLDRWASTPDGPAPISDDPSKIRAWQDARQYTAGWRMCAFNAAREIERGDHMPPPTSASGVPITRRKS